MPENDPTQPLLTFCGFADTRNVGDRALYLTNCELFARSLVRFDQVPEDAKRVVNLFGGGTYYPYSLGRRFKRRRENFAIGLGVHQPEKGRFGMLTRFEMSRWRFGYLGVRGPRSQQVLARHGIKSEVTGDTALAMPAPADVAPDGGTLGVSLVGQAMERRGSRQSVFTHTEVACRRLMAAGVHVRLFAFCKDDMPETIALGDRLSAHGEVELVDFWHAPIDQDLPRYLAALARCDAFICERLHASVLAAVVNRPFVPIGYKPKCHDFVESLAIDGLACVDPATADSDQLYGLAKQALDGSPDPQQLAERVGFFRQRIVTAAQQIIEIVESR